MQCPKSLRRTVSMGLEYMASVTACILASMTERPSQSAITLASL